MSDKLLTLRREPDGLLKPYVDGERIAGCVAVGINTDGNQQVVQVAFHSALILFETARHPHAEKLH